MKNFGANVLREWKLFLLASCCGLVLAPPHPTHAEDLWLADQSAWPGTIMLSEGDTAPRVLLRRTLAGPPGASDAIPKIASVAPTADRSAVYFCSGLDRYIFRFERGRQLHVHTHPAQVRDLAIGTDPNLIFYSVVPTPQNDQPIWYGEIFSYNIATREQLLVKTIQQADLAGDWWGTLAIRNGVLHIATFDQPSRVYRVDGERPALVYTAENTAIRGMTFTGGGEMFFAASDGRLFRVPDLATGTPAELSTRGRLTDVAVPPATR